MSLLITIPVKPFGVAKNRLRPALDAPRRSHLGKTIAARTAMEAQATGARVAIVTGDAGVADWAKDLDFDVVREAPEYGSGLNGAAASAVAAAGRNGSEWLVLHADLPLISRVDIEAAISRHRPGCYVIAPSYDGGTGLLMGSGVFPFSYGPGSFHRHLRATNGAADVVVRAGLALDLDTPRDLTAACNRGLDVPWQGVPA
ncbi:MAG: 2-phospho-L-lactate guanylyltransferase [Acidimicrobiia bacterium]|nr:2-phospho-L-lactate guanylyltransferase [Acidimicrobiia bacterium]